MTEQLAAISWKELRHIRNGTRVVFATSWDIFPECVVQQGEAGVILENELQHGGILVVMPDSPALRETLKAWEGGIHIYNEDIVSFSTDESPLAIEPVKPKETIGYCFEPETFESLRAVMTRLYDDRPLSGDQRRDLANAMHALMGKASPVTG